jgi:hypothetical protein
MTYIVWGEQADSPIGSVDHSSSTATIEILNALDELINNEAYILVLSLDSSSGTSSSTWSDVKLCNQLVPVPVWPMPLRALMENAIAT